MNGLSDDLSRASLRRGVYALLIAISAGAMIGRILAVDAVNLRGVQESRISRRLAEHRAKLAAKGLDGASLEGAMADEETRLRQAIRYERPFLSANDRSRWCMVRVLVEDELRVPGHPYAIDRLVDEPGWDTIDMVKHDGHYYSSKPPLLPTLLAGEYWVIHRLTGATLGTHPYAIGRFLLVANNVVGWVVALVFLAAMAERLGKTDWGRIFVVAAAALGTFLTTFAVTLNNHLVAAASVTIALFAFMRIWVDGRREWRWFALAGLAGAFTAANELPALSFLGLMGAALLVKSPRRTLLGFAPLVVLVGAGFFGTNWIAHKDLRPPYMHRSGDDNWYDYDFVRNGRVVESHWRNPTGLDAGETRPGVYAWHCLLGHHGVFSLTPIWAMSMVGMGLWLRRREDRSVRELAAGLATVTLVCLVFYLFFEKNGRNYGGSTSGLRWMFWMAPLWLVAMLPAADLMSRRRWSMIIAVVLLALSVLSASYPTWNPWSHPWLYDAMRYYGVIGP
ncbi:MAG: DUF2029 domain-containing protein [Pirellulales bacterium]|nr:DUF2029 domain-containing protein [Pirellulales bacterium]